MAYLPAMVAVCFYFEKRRSLATGIAICGSGIGSFVFAPITAALLSEYSWKGTLLVEAGILLNCIVCAMVFRPLTIPKKPCLTEFEVLTEEQPVNVIGAEQSKIAVKSASFELLQTLAETSQDVERRRHFSESQKSSTSCTSSTELVGPMARNDSFYYKSLDHIPQCQANRDEYDRSMMPLKEPGNKSWLAKIGVSKETRQTISEVMDFRLLLDIVFILFGLSNLLTSMGFIVPSIFFPNIGLCLGFEKHESFWLISVLGISNSVGRVVFGFIADMKCVNRLILYNTVRVISGICSLFSVLLWTFPLLMCYSFIFGFLDGILYDNTYYF